MHSSSRIARSWIARRRSSRTSTTAPERRKVSRNPSQRRTTRRGRRGVWRPLKRWDICSLSLLMLTVSSVPVAWSVQPIEPPKSTADVSLDGFQGRGSRRRLACRVFVSINPDVSVAKWLLDVVERLARWSSERVIGVDQPFGNDERCAVWSSILRDRDGCDGRTSSEEGSSRLILSTHSRANPTGVTQASSAQHTLFSRSLTRIRSRLQPRSRLSSAFIIVITVNRPQRWLVRRQGLERHHLYRLSLCITHQTRHLD